MKPEILLVEPMLPMVDAQLERASIVHRPAKPDAPGRLQQLIARGSEASRRTAVVVPARR